MILTKLVISNYGPFVGQQTLIIDENVTVLTGSNDSGKTLVLKLIEKIFSGKPISEDEANLERLHSADVVWNQDKEIYCIATFSLNEKSRKYFALGNPNLIKEGDQIEIKFQLVPEISGHRNQVITSIREGKKLDYGIKRLSKQPKTLFISGSQSIRTRLSLDSLNEIEVKFLDIAFGKNSIPKLKGMNLVNLRRQVRTANSRLSERLQGILPPKLQMKFEIEILSSDSKDLIINIEDQFDGYTPLHLRGNGVRRVINLLAELMFLDPKTDKLFILFDEPENSLHPDAQHHFRSFLEDLAQDDNIQVIYATHSSSMINPFHCSGLRLIYRNNKNNIALSLIDNKPFEDNFSPVRSSLGLSPADSLLYAPIVVIVEGRTELIGIPLILKRLYDGKIKQFKNIDQLFSHTRFIDGQGDSYEYWCRLVLSQGCKPIIYVDGDKIRRIKQQKLEEKMPDVPIITLPEGKEFEQIVPMPDYFQGLSKVLSKTLRPNVYKEWEKTSTVSKKMLFTKKIERWLESIDEDLIYDKPSVMKVVLAEIEIRKVELESLVTLVASMTKIFEKISRD